MGVPQLSVVMDEKSPGFFQWDFRIPQTDAVFLISMSPDLRAPGFHMILSLDWFKGKFTGNHGFYFTIKYRAFL
jgi:hypothetical protein